MPFTTAPNVIEQSDFNGGWAPDPEKVGIESNVLMDMSNLLPDKGGSDALIVRKGFRRLREELVGMSTHYVIAVEHFWTRGEGHHLVVVLTTGTSAANNVRLYDVDLSDGSFTVARIDDAGRNWSNPKADFWLEAVNGILYGGSPGNGVFKWDPAGPTYTANAETLSFDDWVNSITPGAGEIAKDFAFKGNEKVNYSGDSFTPARSIRYKEWDNGEDYVKGERVSLKIDIGGEEYWRSYRCKAAHTAVTATNRPGSGSSFTDFWKKLSLDKPKNADGETNTHDWHFLPTAPGTSVAVWYAHRLWLRYDGQGSASRILYSAPVEPEKGDDVPETVFDITDFSPTDDRKGPGGGWVDLNDGRKEGRVRALFPYGQYLLAFKSTSVWAISGRAEPFTIRKVATDVGALTPRGVTECNGLVYFLNSDGLYVTDGTSVEPVEGNDKVQAWFGARWKARGAAASLPDVSPNVFSYKDRVWMSFPVDGESEEHVTIVYDPSRGAFYKTDLPIAAATVTGSGDTQQIIFGAPATYSVRDLVYTYDHASAGDTDDTGVDVYAGAAITWHARTTWWPFGLAQEQRRIRRVWAVVKGALTYTIKMYRDWSDTEAETQTRAVTSSNPIHIEGETMADSHAISLRVSGASAPAKLYGIAVDTEPRRRRYHVHRTL